MGRSFLCGCACNCAGIGLNNSLLWADFINVPQSTRLHCVPSKVSPEYSTCVCFYFNRFQLQTEGFPFCFRFPVQNVQSVQIQESLLKSQVFPSTLCPLSYCFSCLQTSVFTPAYGSVTNVRVNSSMTTGQVLNLLLHKFRVSTRQRLHLKWYFQ